MDESLAAELLQDVDRARYHVEKPGHLPGSGKFRQEWFEHGPKDMVRGVKAWEAACKDLAKAQGDERKARAALDRVQQIVSTDDAGQGAVANNHESYGELRPELTQLRRKVTAAKKRLKATEASRAAALRGIKEDLSTAKAAVAAVKRQREELEQTVVRTGDSSAETRRRLEEALDAIGRLGQLLRTAKQSHGLDSQSRDGRQ